MPDAFEQSQDAIALVMRRMRIVRTIAELVVTAVDCNPFQERPLHRHRSANTNDELQNAVGFERTVRKQAMKADSDAQTSQKVHNQQQAEVNPAEPPAPQKDGGRKDSQEWQ